MKFLEMIIKMMMMVMMLMMMMIVMMIKTKIILRNKTRRIITMNVTGSREIQAKNLVK